MMKVSGLLLTLLCCISAIGATPKEEAKALFDRSAELSSFWDSSPYHLVIEVNSTVSDKPITGSFRIDSLSRTQYRSRVTLGDYSEMNTFDGSHHWHKSNMEYQPPVVADLWGSLQPLAEIPILSDPQRIYSEKENGTELKCVDYESQNTSACFSADSGLLVRKKTIQFVATYSQYEQLLGKMLPTHIIVEMYNGKHFEATLQLSKADDIRVEMLTPPANAGFEDEFVCHSWTKVPELIKSSKLHFPPGAPKISGSEVLTVWIGTNGKVRHSEVHHSLGAAYDKVAVDAVSGWIYKPASCEGKPYETDIEASINFQP